MVILIGSVQRSRAQHYLILFLFLIITKRYETRVFPACDFYLFFDNYLAHLVYNLCIILTWKSVGNALTRSLPLNQHGGRHREVKALVEWLVQKLKSVHVWAKNK